MSLLLGVSQIDDSCRRSQLERFAVQYTQPLVMFLVGTKRMPVEEASEIVQDFWLAKLISPAPTENLVAKYLETVREEQGVRRSFFRKYLMRAVSNFYLDKLRRNRNPTFSIDEIATVAAPESSHDDTFDIAWANSIFRMIVDAVRAECKRKNQESLWLLFCKQIVVPKLTGQLPPGYAQLAAELNFPDAQSAANAVRTVIRKFQSHLRGRVRDYLPVELVDESDSWIESECIEIIDVLSKSSVLDVKLFDDIIQELQLEESTFIFKEQSMMEHVAIDQPFLVDPQTSLYATDDDLKLFWFQRLNTKVSDWLSSIKAGANVTSLLTFRDLVAGEAISEEDLHVIRNAAKRLSRLQSDEPTCVLATIYLAAIASGFNQHQKLLSNDPPVKIVSRMEQVISYAWLDQDTRQLLKRFVASL